SVGELPPQDELVIRARPRRDLVDRRCKLGDEARYQLDELRLRLGVRTVERKAVEARGDQALRRELARHVAELRRELEERVLVLRRDLERADRGVPGFAGLGDREDVALDGQRKVEALFRADVRSELDPHRVVVADDLRDEMAIELLFLELDLLL